MIIVFKLIGAFLGMKAAMFFGSTPLSGLIVGCILGHSIDIVVSTKINRMRAKRYWKAQANVQYQRIFMTTVFPMLGKICLADGEINTKEVEAVERIINESLKLSRRERKEALTLFRNAVRSPTSFQFDAAQFFEIHQMDQTSVENFVTVMFQVALADGRLSEAEEHLIRSAAAVFNVPERRYVEIRTAFTGSGGSSTNGSHGHANGNGNGAAAVGLGGSDPYAVLGCKPNDSVAVIKQHYRKLVSDYHPDKIVSKELPEDFLRFANEKFKVIQAAYEAVKSERKFT